MKGPGTFKEKNGKYFKAFNNKYRYMDIKIHFYIYFCVFKWGADFINIWRNVYIK